jgi:hypothetical protein
MSQSTFTVEFFRQVLRVIRPKAIYAIDDARNYHELMLASQLEHVPFMAIQHGQFSKYHVGWHSVEGLQGPVASPSKFIVWSQYWKDVLLAEGTYVHPDEILVGGLPKKVRISPHHSKKSSENLNVLIPYEAWAPREYVRRHIRALISCSQVTVYFKLRPGLSRAEQLQSYGLDSLFSNQFHVFYDSDEIMEKIDVVLGVYSTLLYEMIESGKRVAILESPLDYGSRMVKDGLASELKLSGEVCKALSAISLISDDEVERRRRKLVGHVEKDLTDTITRLLSL